MKKNILLMCRLCFFIVFSTGFLFAADADTTVKVVLVKGKVDIRSFDDKEFLPVNIGASLQADTFVRTGRKSMAKLMLRDGSMIDVEESSMIYLNDMLIKDDSGQNAVGLCFGRISLAVKKLGKGGTFNVMTPAAVAGVRGTRFEVASFSDGSVTVKVNEGEVQVDGQDDTAVLGKKDTVGIDFMAGTLKTNVKDNKFSQEREAFASENPGAVMKKMTEEIGEIETLTRGLAESLSEDNALDISGEYLENKNKTIGIGWLADNLQQTNPEDEIVAMYYERVQAIEDRFMEISEMIEGKLRQIDKMFQEKSEAINEKFDEVGTSIDEAEKKFEDLEHRFSGE